MRFGHSPSQITAFYRKQKLRSPFYVTIDPKKEEKAEESVAGTAKPKYLSEAKPNEAFAVIR